MAGGGEAARIGVTIILTTHYIEEAEEIADRIGVINGGTLLLVEEKAALMRKLGRKQLSVELTEPMTTVPPALAGFGVTLEGEGTRLVYDCHPDKAGRPFRRCSRHFRPRASASRTSRRGRARWKTFSWNWWRADDEFRSGQAIYLFEMARTRRTILQSVVSPVISTSLYFIVFGAAVGSRIQAIDGVSYGAFITPGLIMLTLLTQCVGNGSFGIYFPKFTGTIYEILSSPVSMAEIVLGYVGAAATKGMMIGLIILATASFFVDLTIQHPLAMIGFFALTAVTFSLFGFIIGIWAKDFEQLNLIPMLVIRRSSSSAAASIRSPCCRPSGRQQATSTRSST